MTEASVTADLLTFCLGGAGAMGASAILAWRIEHVGGRTRISESLLGLAAALGADSPEITSSVTALRGGQHAVGIGVVLGSNVFNLAALLGIGALAAGRIALHRKVILLEGATSLWIVLSALLLATGVLEPGEALVLALVGFVPYCVLAGSRAHALSRLPIGHRAGAWLTSALRLEDLELGPVPRNSSGTIATDVVTILFSLAAVVFASVMMERAGTSMGSRFHLPAIVVGAVLLAAITSLPNVVAAVYLALHGRGAAVLSEAMNSNALNVIVGLLLPGAIVGLGHSSGVLAIAWWYAALTAGVLLVAYVASGISRVVGVLVLAVYGAFVLTLVLA